MNSESPPQPDNRRRRLVLTLAPLIVFLALAALFLMQLGKDASRVPSALIGRPVPEFALPKLDGVAQPPFATADLKAGKVSLVNIFASWCGPCRDEHPQLMKLAADPKLKAAGVQIIGLNYKDQNANARRFLEQLGNPYTHIGVDAAGRASIEWGVYGVPETFIVKGDGTIAYKFIGPISAQALEKTIMPQIERALASPTR